MDLSAYNGTLKLRFYFHHEGGDFASVWLDDVSIGIPNYSWYTNTLVPINNSPTEETFTGDTLTFIPLILQMI